MWNYSEKVKDHFFHPRNVGEVDNPDGVGEVGSLACGDALRLTFKLDNAGRIADAKFQTFGCASAIASASALTEIIKGMPVDDAARVTNRDIAAYLGGLPEEKMHCSVMGREALEAAIANYRGKAPARRELEGKLVCTCFGVTDKEIERVILENNLSTVEQVTHYSKAGGGCGSCRGEIQAIIDRIRGKKPVEAAPRPSARAQPLTNIAKIQLIQETLEREIRPALRKDGGDIELIDVEGNGVIIVRRGTCVNCPSSQLTAEFIESKLKEFVSEEIYVKEVRS